jgi:dipeptidyl aminopeptidase/acylaminoacyl peptidase
MRLCPPRKSLSAAALIFCAAFHFSAIAQNANAAPTSAQIEDLLRSFNRGHSIGQVAISPNGKRLAFIINKEIRVAPLDAIDNTQRVTAASSPGQRCAEGSLAWSPDSAALAFLSSCDASANQSETQANLYLAHFDGNPPLRLTNLKGYVHSPAFSPDGKSIAFLYVEDATRPAGALAAMKPPSGVIGEDGVEIQRIAVADAGAAQPAAPAIVSPASLHVYEFDWSPDSKSLAYIAADPPGENNWWVAKLYTQQLSVPNSAGAPEPALSQSKGPDSGTWDRSKPNSLPRPILAPAEISGPLHGLQIAVPRWSPDGKSIAFIGGLMSDQGATGGDVWILPSTGGQPRNLTPNRPSSPAWIEWEDNQDIFVSELAGSDSRLTRLHLQGDPAAPDISAFSGSPIYSIPGTIGDGRLELSLSSTSDRSLFVFHASTFDSAPEIFVARTGAPPSSRSADSARFAQFSHFNDDVKPAWGKSVSLDWTSDGFQVQGWLMLPKDYDPAKKYPLIVEVHGGPASAVTAAWGARGALSPAAFSALGYFVLQPNPRGSYGQGEAFTQANRKDFGYGDLRDILAGVDAVQAHYSVDSNRVGLTGWSYGGFMTMFAITQTHRFRAAVAGAGISDWLSYYGENSIDQWMIPYFGASVYDDPAVYAKSSAIDFIKQATTPTLTVVGDRDGECPAPQSFEFWHALRDLHVPAQLVVYPNEGHGFTDPAHRADVFLRAVDWFARYMPPPS